MNILKGAIPFYEDSAFYVRLGFVKYAIIKLISWYHCRISALSKKSVRDVKVIYYGHAPYKNVETFKPFFEGSNESILPCRICPKSIRFYAVFRT